MKKRVAMFMMALMLLGNNVLVYAEEVTVQQLQEKIVRLEERVTFLEELLLSLGFMEMDDGTVDETESNETEDVTMGMKNALGSAENYLSFMGISHKGIIQQLEFEGYTNEEAVYAADNCGANWNEEAAEAAESYLDVMSFSKDGLIQQLQFDGFTAEQALYAATASGY